MDLQLAAGDVRLPVGLLDNETARAFVKWLPVEAKALRWGEEIYFYTDKKLLAAGGTLEVEIGDVCYWIDGPGLAIFFGKTPASRADGKPRPASEVVVIGRISGDAKQLSKVKEGAKVTISKA